MRKRTVEIVYVGADPALKNVSKTLSMGVLTWCRKASVSSQKKPLCDASPATCIHICPHAFSTGEV
jgi:hypothetical protein